MKLRKQYKQDDTLSLQGIVQVGEKTKELLMTIKPKQIAVIKHRDIDEIAARDIIRCKVKAVINADVTMTGSYPTKGPLLLLRAGIPILEITYPSFKKFYNHQVVKIHSFKIHVENHQIPYSIFTEDKYKNLLKTSYENLPSNLNHFIENTLQYAQKEKDFVIQSFEAPTLNVRIENRPVVIVVRGKEYRNDLLAIKDYIEDIEPVLIGVDGGADALLEHGYQPHVIIGDMDSVSDDALLSNAEIIVHAYPDGKAPGLERINALGLKAKTLSATGTSEDISMLLAYEKKAELIITLGAHSHMIDFLEKGRKGMSSTLLVRMKIGDKLIDAKGVSQLYQRKVKFKNIWPLPIAAMFPVVILTYVHPGVRDFLYIYWNYVKISIF
ncbi:putative cytokinetic ring protein SteA [Chengkuizengella axinellae]|uniref:Cytokinetic ring protein SteA n=1 Tax=Chengkuizengella axinellae TaxID=3064388 RepID=A0ABT9IWA7_9BACL|nr:putative cytokinetic ring protein SteA [Chengkuizengella sp. 2205SS18-9]MDP5273618.1 putative cytokinetic ring protein SteA [Chengkuizengella sp. 2205SS18-9]